MTSMSIWYACYFSLVRSLTYIHLFCVYVQSVIVCITLMVCYKMKNKTNCIAFTHFSYEVFILMCCVGFFFVSFFLNAKHCVRVFFYKFISNLNACTLISFSIHNVVCFFSSEFIDKLKPIYVYVVVLYLREIFWQ